MRRRGGGGGEVGGGEVGAGVKAGRGEGTENGLERW